LSINFIKNSPFMDKLKNLLFVIVTLFSSPIAIPNVSKPGPKLALVAGTFIVINFLYTAGRIYSGKQSLVKSLLFITLGKEKSIGLF